MILLGSFGLLLGCGGSDLQPLESEVVVVDPFEVQLVVPEVARPVNDRARFLAGLSANEMSPYAGLQQSYGRVYRNHSEDLWGQWEKFSYNRVKPMTAWTQDYLGQVSGTIFYPFGGPDVLNALTMFPQAQRVILIGMEPVGGFVQDPLQLGPGDNLAALARFRQGVSTLTEASYFVTKDMKVDFSQPPLVGVSPVMQGLLALAGYEILAAEETSLGGVPAARIKVSKVGRGTVQELIYLQGDLSDGGPSSMLSWVKGQNPRAVYLKAASYLLHESYFSRIKGLILEVNGPIVQDDSGVPFADLQRAGRRIQLFGEYRGVLDIFDKYQQNDMARSYALVQAPELPFSSGYAVRFGKSNLQVAWPQGAAPVGARRIPQGNVAAPRGVAPREASAATSGRYRPTNFFDQ